MKIELITRLILFAATCRADISAVHYSIVEAGVDSTIYFINETSSMTCDGCDLQPSDDDTVKVRVKNLPFFITILMIETKNQFFNFSKSQHKITRG